MHRTGVAAPSGTLTLTKFQNWPLAPSLWRIVKDGIPHPGLGREVNAWRARNLPNLWRGLWKLAVARLFGLQHVYGALYLEKLTPNGRIMYGLASLRVVTDTGVGFIVDAFQNSVELENMKFHGFGTGGAAEAVGNTALTTEETTQYATDNTRPTGSQTETSANIYRTVGTYSPDSGGTRAITEHGIFSQAATGGGVLLDRSLFSVVNLVAGSDSLQATYDFTVTSGG